MDWTEDKVEGLRRLWGEGYSASQIATQLGGISRNAVIGKAHRLHLTPRPSPIKRAAKADGVGGKTCSWPVGDPKTPGFHFCGEPTEPNKTYCAAHAGLAYQKKQVAA